MSTPNLTATQAAPPPTNAAHTRDNRGVLADLEKRTLIWIAHRLPGSHWP
jgi:hypothetical protein